jgi:hypothetical protein
MKTTTLSEQLGRLFTAKREEMGDPSWRIIERRMIALLGDHAPSHETIRQYHAGTVSDARISDALVSALIHFYGITDAELPAPIADRQQRLRSILSERNRGLAA